MEIVADRRVKLLAILLLEVVRARLVVDVVSAVCRRRRTSAKIGSAASMSGPSVWPLLKQQSSDAL